MVRQRVVLVAALALASIASAAGYYLPGTYPQEFVEGQQLQGNSARQLRKIDWMTGACRCYPSRSYPIYLIPCCTLPGCTH